MRSMETIPFRIPEGKNLYRQNKKAANIATSIGTCSFPRHRTLHCLIVTYLFICDFAFQLSGGFLPPENQLQPLFIQTSLHIRYDSSLL